MSDKHVDPVCGMEVTEEEAACSVEFQGKKFYFCNEACRDQFSTDPSKFIEQRD
ncbi:YHS domain-containing protein [candidate division WOR-3 bacterium]|nr:YHS domain-containing protein [candidate division WOR-3 bacterium]